jgi:hypothetical protein
VLSDSVTLTGISISTGTVNLEISNSQNSSSTLYADTRPGYSVSLSPDSISENYFFLRNSSSSAITFDIYAKAINLTGDVTTMENSLQLVFLPVDGSGNATGAGVTTSLAALRTQAVPLNVGVVSGTTQRFKMTLSANAGFSQVIKTVGYDLELTGVQHVI